MKTIYNQNQVKNLPKKNFFSLVRSKNLKQEKPHSILQENQIEDDFLDGDFTQKIIISALNNWSKQHLNPMEALPIHLSHGNPQRFKN